MASVEQTGHVEEVPELISSAMEANSLIFNGTMSSFSVCYCIVAVEKAEKAGKFKTFIFLMQHFMRCFPVVFNCFQH